MTDNEEYLDKLLPKKTGLKDLDRRVETCKSILLSELDNGNLIRKSRISGTLRVKCSDYCKGCESGNPSEQRCLSLRNENLPSKNKIARVIARNCYGDSSILSHACEFERNCKEAAKTIFNLIKGDRK